MRRRHELTKEIRQSEVGRAALERLLDDPAAAVRLLAATDSLAWRSPRGETVLEEIEDANERYAFDAKWTLRSYRSGKLDLDWLADLTSEAVLGRSVAARIVGISLRLAVPRTTAGMGYLAADLGAFPQKKQDDRFH